MAVAGRGLAVREEALRHHKIEAVPGARHRDVEQPALLLDLVAGASAEIGGNAAVDGVKHENRAPFLSLGGMDGGQDQIVFVEQRRAGLAGAAARRCHRTSLTRPGRR